MQTTIQLQQKRSEIRKLSSANNVNCFTVILSTLNVGRAARCIKNAKSVTTPANSPNSTPTDKHAINVIAPGNSSRRLHRHNGRTTSYSIINITADIMTALRAALGMYRKYGVKMLKAANTIIPVNMERKPEMVYFAKVCMHTH